MEKDDPKFGGVAQTAITPKTQSASRAAPGKVTLASKLSPAREPAVQRKAQGSGAGTSQARPSRLAAMDSWMDAAHRGGSALPDSQPAVQARGDVAADDPTSVHRAAAAGVSGAGSSLPHVDRIQQAFGGAHDIGQVRAHVGGEAAAASEHMGAEAYATGDQIAFRSSPDLHTAAHEAAHVIQQRGGVQLDGGVGQAGDAYERHADAVADAIVSGRSAEPLLGGGAAAASSQGAVQRQGRNVQFFGSLEHKTLGDNVTGGAEYDLGGHNAAIDASAYNQAFRLTHGDIVMLSGDYFSPRDTRVNDRGQHEPDPDSLFLLGGIPSMNPGQNVGTWDEVVYGIKKALPSDPRFSKASTPEHPNGHPWAHVTFSDAVMAAVDGRYLRRAASNDEHFVAPTGTDRGPTAGDGRSAGGSYRALHEAAMLMAYDQGTHTNANAREAAAQHFLTDHFAAGHVRTPRGSIRAHWSVIYPLFWDNIRNKIALDVATWINDNDRIGNIATVDQIYTDVQGQVAAQTASIPPMGFDDLVSLVAHDFDNENGVWVCNDIGVSWKLYGDGNLDNRDEHNRTREMCETAVRLGIADITAAAQLGANKGATPLTPQQVCEAVRGQTAGPAAPHATKFGPEQILPRPDTARAGENGVQGWQQPDIDSLWQARVHSSAKETYGEVIAKSMDTGGELERELAGMAEKFPESQTVKSIFTVHPRQGFIEGFLRPLTGNARAGLLSIINFSPSRGQASFNEDDAVMREINGEDGNGGMTAQQLAGLTLEQKAERVRALIGGFWSWVGEDEGETVIRLFETTSAGQRRVLYQMVEGHRWEGDFRHGVFTIDDDLYDSLTSSQLDRLRALIGV
jgi:Domain of unknown function (DUF4157)